MISSSFKPRDLGLLEPRDLGVRRLEAGDQSLDESHRRLLHVGVYLLKCGVFNLFVCLPLLIFMLIISW